MTFITYFLISNVIYIYPQGQPPQKKSGCTYDRNQILVSRTLLRLQCSSPLRSRRSQINDKMLTMCICHFSLLSSPKSFPSTYSLIYGINHKVPHIIHWVFVRGVEELSISHSVAESVYRAVRCLSSDLAFVHSRFVIASVLQTSLEISLLFLVFVFRCCFDALVAGSSCRSINK